MVTLVGYAITALISAGLSYLAHLLTKPKRAKPPFDSTPTTIAKSGTPIPQLVGCRRIGPVVGWAGRRVSYVGASGRHYFESRWDQLCVGPAFRLKRIWQADRVLWEGPISRDDTPSGTTITFPDNDEDGGSWFTIYWGECDQGEAPPDEVLVAELGTVSIWPHLCHIVWGRKALGFSPAWQQLDYELEARVESDLATLEDSDAWLPATTAVSDEGVNPGHALWMFITGAYPHGIGVPAVGLSDAGFEELGTVCQSEHLPCNMLVGGEDVTDVVADFMKDIGFYVPHEGGRVRPRIIRPEDPLTVPMISADLIVNAEPEQEFLQGPTLPNRLEMSFSDRNAAYSTREAGWDLDGSIRGALRPRTLKVDLPNVTDRRTAFKITRRRLMELMTEGETFKFTATRGARRLVPGLSVVLEGYGQIRVQSVALKTTSAAVEVGAVRDQYSHGISTYFPANVDETTIPGTPTYGTPPVSGEVVIDGGTYG